MPRQQKQIIAFLQTDRVWLLGRYALDHRFPLKQIGSGLWGDIPWTIAFHQNRSVLTYGRHPMDHRFPSKQIGSGLWSGIR